MVKNSEHLAIMTNRENMYGFLKRLYRAEVDENLFDQMKEMNFPVECCNIELGEGYQLLEKYLENCGNNPVDDLAVDYAKVFLGAGIAADKAAFPYESVYTSQKNIMMQEARDEVMAIYAAKDLKTCDGKWKLVEDHISFELEFMAFLCHEAQGILEEHNDAQFSFALKEQMDFLKNHLLNWIPIFCNDIEKYANTEFYKAIGKITNGYLNLDREILESLMD